MLFDIILVFGPLVDTLGDGKVQAREAAQDLLQVIMEKSVASPKAVLGRVMGVCLTHKHIQMKQGGLVCPLTAMRT